MDNAPRYICRLNESTVAVTVGTQIKLMSITDKLTLLRRISVNMGCYGIASYQHNIIVDVIGDSLLTYDGFDKLINRIMSYNRLQWHNTRWTKHIFITQ
ncbi:hypothetical protein ACJMK2_016864 [Sinanodonta woodiana]|uniref:Uncharacterized protein n=1 Tax=Sinanodonta woodiana TaxID=1069815 RepID=A0ABD3UYE7_SINWO